MNEIEEQVKQFTELVIPELTRKELEERLIHMYKQLLYNQEILNKIDKLINY